MEGKGGAYFVMHPCPLYFFFIDNWRVEKMVHTWEDIWRFRELLYSFLASIILEPINETTKKVLTRDFWSNFPLEAVNQNLETGLNNLNTCAEGLEKLDEGEAIKQVMLEYTMLFIGPGVPKASPIESFYHSGKLKLFGEKTIEMRQLLAKYGLESTVNQKQPEDHIGLELLFLSVLTQAFLNGNEEGRLANIKEQYGFIKNRLLQWVPQMCHDAEEHSSTGFYSGLIKTILGVLEWDKEVLEEYLSATS